MTTPQQDIQAAIDKLARLRESSTDQKWIATFEEADSLPPRTAVVSFDGYRLPDAELIVTLHATVDAQLEILELALEYGHLPVGSGSRFIALADHLARAILGGK